MADRRVNKVNPVFSTKTNRIRPKNPYGVAKYCCIAPDIQGLLYFFLEWIRINE
jgi:hypothetical protein